MQRAKEALDAGLAAGSKELSPPPAAAPRGLPADSRAVLAKPEPSRLRPGQLMEFRRCEGVEVKLWGRQVRVSVGEWQEGSDVLVTARTKPDSTLLATARDAANVRSSPRLTLTLVLTLTLTLALTLTRARALTLTRTLPLALTRCAASRSSRACATARACSSR